jgi:hypothetical protein
MVSTASFRRPLRASTFQFLPAGATDELQADTADQGAQRMPDEKKGEVRWLPQPEEQDYPGAADYLSLLESDDVVAAIVASLKVAPVQHRKAKDILRAARLVLLPEDNAHVASDLKKIKEGKKLSPILMVRGDLARGIPAMVADGYHRVCASYYTDENTDIPLKLADAPR